MDERLLSTELRRAALRLRKRELERALPGLRYLLSESEEEGKRALEDKVVALSAKINALTQLINPPVSHQAGKVDSAATG